MKTLQLHHETPPLCNVSSWGGLLFLISFLTHLVWRSEIVKHGPVHVVKDCCNDRWLCCKDCQKALLWRNLNTILLKLSVHFLAWAVLCIQTELGKWDLSNLLPKQQMLTTVFDLKEGYIYISAVSFVTYIMWLLCLYALKVYICLLYTGQSGKRDLTFNDRTLTLTPSAYCEIYSFAVKIPPKL